MRQQWPGGSTEREKGASEVRLVPVLPITGLAVDLARSVAGSLYERYLVIPAQFPNSPVIPIEAMYLGQSILSFAFSPCLMFVSFYLLGKDIPLDNDWKSPAVSLFAGGAIAAFLGIFASSAIFGESFLPAFENGWSLGTWAIGIVGESLFVVFTGIAAIYLASRRTRSGKGVADPATPGASSLASPWPNS